MYDDEYIKLSVDFMKNMTSIDSNNLQQPIQIF